MAEVSTVSNAYKVGVFYLKVLIMPLSRSLLNIHVAYGCLYFLFMSQCKFSRNYSIVSFIQGLLRSNNLVSLTYLINSIVDISNYIVRDLVFNN